MKLISEVAELMSYHLVVSVLGKQTNKQNTWIGNKQMNLKTNQLFVEGKRMKDKKKDWICSHKDATRPTEGKPPSDASSATDDLTGWRREAQMEQMRHGMFTFLKVALTYITQLSSSSFFRFLHLYFSGLWIIIDVADNPNKI